MIFEEDFNAADEEVVEAMQYWAELAEKTKALLVSGKGDQIGTLLDQNFDKRREIYAISEGNQLMVDTARNAGATAKFTGSGGAIVGTYEDEAMFDRLKQSLEPQGMKVIKPIL